MVRSIERKQRRLIKILFAILGGVLLLAAISWGGHYLYVRWQERRLIGRATADLEHGDYRDANLAARTILAMKPSSAPAARVMAQLAELNADRSALDWRRKAVQLEPDSVLDALALARCAVQWNDIATAKRTLDAVKQTAGNRADYHAACALLAQATHDDEKADREWTEAIRLAPDDASYRCQLGTLQLRAQEPQRHASGEAMLTALRADPGQRASATRALITDGASRHINNDILLKMAQELQAYPESTFNDRIVYLDILRQLRVPEFTKYLTVLEEDAASDPIKLTALITWMSTSGLSLMAIDFVRGIQPEIQAKWPVPLALAEAHAKLADWNALEALIVNKDWKQSDFMRHAYLARALRGQNKMGEADKEWALSAKQAAAQPAFLSMLTRTTSDWRWEKEWLELLWNLTKYPETQLEALQNLYQKYSNDGDTAGIYRVLVRLADLLPEDERLQNNFAQICLLLNANTERAQKLAAELHQRKGSDPAYAATFAFALYSRGDTEGALEIMRKLNPTQLREPAIAAYYGIFQAAAGNTQGAREYLKLGATAKLLPEEKTLIANAEKSLK